MNSLKIRIKFQEFLLGTSSANPEIHRDFIASKAPDAPSTEEEVEAIGVEDVVEKSLTVFPKLEDGTPHLWDYQIKGFFKDACSMLRRTHASKSTGLTTHKKIIDGLIFVKPRKIPLILPEGEQIAFMQRPLRAQTAQGERIALVNSETVPEDTYMDLEIVWYDLKESKNKKQSSLRDYIVEWLDYGELRGIGQWRNAGFGAFSWSKLNS